MSVAADFEVVFTIGHEEITGEILWTCDCGEELVLELEPRRLLRCPECETVWTFGVYTVKARDSKYTKGVRGNN